MNRSDKATACRTENAQTPMIKLNLAHVWQLMTQNLWAQHTSAQKLFEAVLKPSRATIKTLAKKVTKEIAKWSAVVKAAGVKAE